MIALVKKERRDDAIDTEETSSYAELTERSTHRLGMSEHTI